MNATDDMAAGLAELAKQDALESALAQAKANRDINACRAVVPRINALRKQCAGIKRARRLANATPAQKLEAAIFGDDQ